MPVATRRRAPKSSRSTAFSRLASPLVAAALTLAFVAGSLVAGATVAPLPAADAATTPAPTVAITFDPAKNGGKDSILAGTNAVYSLTVTNGDAAPWFNLGVRLVVPNGIVFVPTSKLGTPVVYASGSQITNASTGSTTTAVAAGSQVWVWEDVSDLPAGARYSADFTVAPQQKAPGTAVDAAANYFPVGSTISLSGTAHASDVATLKPLFSGSTGVRTAAALAATHSSAAATASTRVVALHVTKDEPSAESELLRGVHDQTTVYTLTVKNSTQGKTDATQLVDYLPAGLEFLGCGATDNSRAEEYAASGPLSATPVVNGCVVPARVETVERIPSNRAAFPAAMGADASSDGVFTKVTWALGTLAAGEVRTVRYAAGIPLFSNVSWTGVAPSETALAQVANLDNNTGASTRHSDNDGPATDGDVYTNFAAATGVYAGIVRAAADRPSGDHDEEIVHSMDLRILKSVDANPTDGSATSYSGADGGFRTGYVAKYTLDLRASEYTDTTGAVITDRVPNGLCPVVPAGTAVQTGDISIPQLDGTVKHVTGSAALPAECGVGAASSQGAWANPAVSGPASIAWVAYDAATGDFYLRFTAVDIAAGATASIVYPVLMRQTYENNAGLTSAQDHLTNTAVFTATTTTTADAFTRDSAARVQSVADDSSASLTSGSATISKRVLPVSTPLGSSADPCPAGGYSAATESGFKLGDTVCYELTVGFQPDADTRNPLITDMLPVGVTYTDSASSLTNGGAPVAFSDNVVEPAAGGSRITWAPSTTTVDGDRFVPRGSTLTIHVWGTVSTLSLDPAKLDKPQNLMKFQQENVHGDVFFLRDSADILVDAGLSLVKGVARVGASTTFAASNGNCVGTAPNCDHVLIKEGDVVTYRVDITGARYAVSNVVVWDALPAGITAADVVPNPAAYDVVSTPPAGYDGPAGRSVVVWKPLAIAANTTTSLTYVVNMPGNITSGTTYSNTASIISYDVDNNSGTSTYRPFNSLGSLTGNNVPGARTTDNSDVYVPPATIDKSVVSTGIDAAADPDNGSKVTHGEDITYRMSATVPARTSVSGAVLQDDGFLSRDGGTTQRPYVAGSATVAYPADATQAASAFTFNTTTGRLQFPALYDNATDAAQTFTVTITLHSTFDWANGDTLTNRARFTANGMAAVTDTATVAYTQPSPRVAKTVASGGAKVTAGQSLTYTLAVNNDPTRPIAYDTVVTDCVPSQLTAVTYVGSPSQGSAVAPEVASPSCGGTGTLITWNVGDVAAGGADRTLSYTVTVDPSSAGGASYTNTAQLTAWALDSSVAAPRNLKLTGSSPVTVTIDGAKLVKTASPATASIGDAVSYSVDVTLPINVNFYDATITDPAPSGVRLTGPVTVADAGTGVTCAVVANAISCSTLANGGSILSSPTLRHVVLSYSGVVVATSASPVAPVKGDQPNNVATFAWKTTPGGSTPQSVSGNARFTVVEPSLAIAKRVEGQDADTPATAVSISPGQARAYTVVVTNPAGANGSTAYGAVVVDDVPATLVVDPASLTAGGVLSANGRVVTWTIASLAQGASATLGYSATLAPTAGLTVDPTLASTRNNATVTEFYSAPDSASADRRRYYPGPANSAYVRPLFPHITVAKDTTAGDLAKVGEPFSWTVTLTNTGGATAKSIVATDTLPANWAYSATTKVSLMRAGTVSTLGSAGYTFSAADLAWTFANVDPGDSIVIVYTATPSAGAYGDPGVGAPLTVPNTNSVAITRVTDATDATGNRTDVDFADGPDTAAAYLVATDVAVSKTRVGTAQVNAGDLVDFTLTAENRGAQAADGVVIVDSLPAGLTFDPARVAAPVTPGSDFVCSVTSASAIRCALTGSLAAGASTSVTVRAFAREIPAALASTTLTNAADITTTTPETDVANNHAELAVVVFAPRILIVKTGAFAPGAVGAVGEVIDYEFTVTNLVAGATLTGVEITDAMFPAAGDITYGTWPSGTTGTLRAGESVVAHASYPITQADINAGFVRNLASVTGVPPVGADVTDTDTVDVAIANTPSILLEKTGVLAASAPTRAGQKVDYSFTVTNTGNVTLGSVGIADHLAGVSAVRFAAGFTGSLAPGASVTATADYTLSQADVDAGSVANTAEASGLSPRGDSATDAASAAVAIAPVPAILLEKSAVVDPAGTFVRGDRVLYDFTVRNTGTVTLSGVRVTDAMAGLSAIDYTWPGQPGVLAPGEAATATADYAMTQADLDAGSIENTAVADGTGPGATGVSSTDSATVKLTPKPTIGLAMTARFAANSRGLVGDTVYFDYVITNTGNLTLAGLRLTSRLRGISAMSYGQWPVTEFTLAPGESVTATASYQLTVADVLAGRVDNDSEVTAVARLDGVTNSVADEDSAAVPVPTLLAATGFSLVTPLEIVALLLLLGFALLILDLKSRRRRVG
jgi:fimbrial isopeptide formation D2 family protein/uncharacterized repeat protein (TIGR01451 family)